MILVNGLSKYEVGKQVAATPSYRVYLCEEVDSGRQVLLQIAAEAKYNGGLDRARYILGELKRLADEVEALYAETRPDAAKMLGYDRLCPVILDSFVCQEQGGRRVNIMAFRGVDEVTKMVPLSNLVSKDRLRVDLRTSAWIMGRLLKLLVFVHSSGITAPAMDGNNILIEPKRHSVVVFDWSSATTHYGKIAIENRAENIAQAARAVIAALGGDLKTGKFPDADDASRQYTEYLLLLANFRESNAERAHHRFYELVDQLWERKYYPFTTKPLGG